MVEDDSAYLTRRAEEELEQAQRAIKPEVVHTHYQLAQAYLDRLNPDDRASFAQGA